VKIEPCEKTNFDVDLETYMESEMSNPLDLFIKVDFGASRIGLPKINVNRKYRETIHKVYSELYLNT